MNQKVFVANQVFRGLIKHIKMFQQLQPPVVELSVLQGSENWSHPISFHRSRKANNNNLMVDGETYECVKSFCYPGETLDRDGGAGLAATARIRNGWMKIGKLLPFLNSRAPLLEMKGQVYANCVRSSMTYGSETRPLLVDVGLKFERAEMQMIRWMCPQKDK